MKPARILVVDDEPGMLRAVERVLSGTYHVIGTRSSRDALSVAAEFNPDLAIVDIRMPDLDGFELMARLKARFPELDVILMTGSVDDLDEKLVRAIRSPAFYFIQKPFDREVLKTLVERCVELRWRRTEHRRHLKRLETEMAEARAFQQSLLPDREAVVNRLAICCRYTPCSGLGGDLYDYAAAASGQTALLIADVSGHGVSAAMLTGIVKSAFQASHVDGFEPLAVVQRVWTGLAAFSPERFVTLVAALIAPDRAPAAICECGPSADRRCGAARGSPSGWRAPGRWSPRCCPGPRGTCGWCRLTRAISCCCIRTASRRSSPTPTAAQKRDSRHIIERASAGGAPLLDAILAEVQHDLAGRPQPDDLTLLTARVLALDVSIASARLHAGRL